MWKEWLGYLYLLYASSFMAVFRRASIILGKGYILVNPVKSRPELGC